jgi:DNA-binding PadR family transcriptional regulator
MARTRTGPTPAELVLLGLLAEGAAHPYSLDVKLREGGSSTEVAFSSIYAALDRLEKLGLVSSRPDAGARGKARRVYKLSSQGKTTLRTAARMALAKPINGARPNELGIANILLLTRTDALAAIADARKLLADERKARPATEESSYPQAAVVMHRTMLLAAEERFYAELERLVQRSHPERLRKRGDDDEAE